MIFFVVLIGLLGFVFGVLFGDFVTVTILTVFFAIIYTLIMYVQGSSVVLALSGAREVTKKEFPYYYNTVEGLSIAAGIPMPKIYVIEDTALNAFATGRDPQHAAVCATSGLLAKMNRQELEGVLAHEMSHVLNYDIRMMMLAAVLVGIVTLLSDFLLRVFLFGGLRSGNNKRENGNQLTIIFIIVGLLLAILAPIIAQLIKLAISRKREFAADASGARLTRYPEGLASALEKIKNDPDPLVDHANKATAHLFISTPFRKTSGWLTGLFSTHPPIEERIRRLRAM